MLPNRLKRSLRSWCGQVLKTLFFMAEISNRCVGVGVGVKEVGVDRSEVCRGFVSPPRLTLIVLVSLFVAYLGLLVICACARWRILTIDLAGKSRWQWDGIFQFKKTGLEQLWCTRFHIFLLCFNFFLSSLDSSPPHARSGRIMKTQQKYSGMNLSALVGVIFFCRSRKREWNLARAGQECMKNEFGISPEIVQYECSILSLKI